MASSDENKTPHEMIRRVHRGLDQIHSRTNALHKAKAIGGLYKTFGSQSSARLNPVDQRLRIDPLLNDEFFCLKRLMGMWFMCRFLLADSLGKLPRIRREQHRRTDTGVNGWNDGSPWGQTLHLFMDLSTLFRMNEINFVQD